MNWEFTWLYALQELHNPVLDAIMVFFTTLGNTGMIWIFFALFMLCFKKYRETGLVTGMSLMTMLLVGNIMIKNLVQRARPCWIDESVQLLVENPTDYSFPSGHTYASFAAATAIFLHHKKLGIAAYALALIIAFSRMYLFVHFPTDILGGAVLGIGTAIAMNLLFRFLKSKKAKGKACPDDTK